MKVTDTISVNPGKATLGQQELKSTIFRSNILDNATERRSTDWVKVLFPSYKMGATEYNKYAVPLRTLFATILIVTGISLFTTPYNIYGEGYAICSLCFGALLAMGFFTRPLMAGASIFYCVFGALLLRTGVADISVFSLMFGCLIFCVIGSGKYSFDTIIRQSILRHKKNVDKKRKENMMSYKAFHNVGF